MEVLSLFSSATIGNEIMSMKILGKRILEALSRNLGNSNGLFTVSIYSRYLVKT